MQIPSSTINVNNNYSMLNSMKKGQTSQQTVPFELNDKKTGENSNKNKAFGKFVIYLVAAAALIMGAIIEIKSNKNHKLEKENALKAKEELEKLNQELKKELEKSLQEFKELKNKLNEKLIKSNDITEETQNVISTVNRRIETQQASLEQISSEIKNISQDDILELKQLQDEMNKIQEEVFAIQSLSHRIGILNEASGANKEKGFGRIIGYETEKAILREKIVKPFEENQTQKIPNLIILYGPQGTGKSQISHSITEEIPCNTVSFITSLDEKTDIEALKGIMETAKRNFSENGKRTFILMDEAENFLSTNSNEAKLLIENLANGYNSTIIATTNYPKSINKGIMVADKVEKIYLPPLRTNDLPQFIEYYSNQFVKEPINYEEIANIITNKSETGSYSNAHIEQIIKTKIKSITDLSKENASIDLLQQKDLVEAFQNSSPDITKEILNNYNNIL